MKSRILETLATIAAPLVVLLLVVALSAVPSGTAEAKALSAGSVPSVSLPYVDDVNPSGSGYVLTVTCAGSAKTVLKASVGGKSLKVAKVRARVWTVEVPRNKEVKLSVRANGKWKSIGYRVY